MNALARLLSGFCTQPRRHWQPGQLHRIVQIHFRLERLTIPARHYFIAQTQQRLAQVGQP